MHDALSWLPPRALGLCGSSPRRGCPAAPARSGTAGGPTAIEAQARAWAPAMPRLAPAHPAARRLAAPQRLLIGALSLRASMLRARVGLSRTQLSAGDFLRPCRARSAGALAPAGGATEPALVRPRPRQARRSLRVLRFSTTTVLDRPWLKFCRTWPELDCPLQGQWLARSSAAQRGVGRFLGFTHAISVQLRLGPQLMRLS